ncbi:MAG: hypothetical protein ABJN26_22710 [Stappiaceae bacterium]
MNQEIVIPEKLNRVDASSYLRAKHGISRTPGTLAVFACKGKGPMFRKDGRQTVVYDVTELDRWAREILGKPINKASEAA